MFRRRLPSDRLKTFLPPPVLFLCCFLTVLFVFLIQWPIEAFDTDLWYHLAAGRYFAIHGQLPHDSFFSFLFPLRGQIDYYWLFQSIVYRIYQLCGYEGLLNFRALLCAATAAALLELVFDAKKPGRASTAWPVFLIVLCLLVLLPRWLVVRPHLVTYFLIAIFLWILEKQAAWIWALPVLAVFWCNVHGVTYPVLWLILGAYALEQRRRNRLGQAVKSRRRTVLLLLLCALAAFITPHGIGLLRMPFVGIANTSAYIQELHQPGLDELLSVQVVRFVPTEKTFTVLLLAVICLSFIAACRTRRLRISHAALLLGGLFLFFRAQRFVCEMALLSLPLLKANPIFPRGALKQAPRFIYGLALLAGMIMPIAAVANLIPGKPAYPVSSAGLPRGTCAFLNAAGPGGRVLNYPNNGGYLEWTLKPEYKIYADLQVPFLFSDADIQRVRDAYNPDHPQALAGLLQEYQPDFILVPIEFRRLGKQLKKQTAYTLVFFDDAEVLYVNKAAHPGLARGYRLTSLDPFEMPNQKLETVVNGDGGEILPKDRAALMPQLRRLLAVYPRIGFANGLAAWICNDEARYGEGLKHARLMAADFPNNALANQLYGDSLRGLGRYAQALRAYQQALRCSVPANQPVYRRKIGQLYLAAGKIPQGYALIKKYTSPYEEGASAEDVFYLGHAALLMGKRGEAREAFDYFLGVYPESGLKYPWLDQLKNDLKDLGLSQQAAS